MSEHLIPGQWNNFVRIKRYVLVGRDMSLGLALRFQKFTSLQVSCLCFMLLVHVYVCLCVRVYCVCVVWVCIEDKGNFYVLFPFRSHIPFLFPFKSWFLSLV